MIADGFGVALWLVGFALGIAACALVGMVALAALGTLLRALRPLGWRLRAWWTARALRRSS